MINDLSLWIAFAHKLPFCEIDNQISISKVEQLHEQEKAAQSERERVIMAPPASRRRLIPTPSSSFPFELDAFVQEDQ